MQLEMYPHGRHTCYQYARLLTQILLLLNIPIQIHMADIVTPLTVEAKSFSIRLISIPAYTRLLVVSLLFLIIAFWLHIAYDNKQPAPLKKSDLVPTLATAR